MMCFDGKNIVYNVSTGTKSLEDTSSSAAIESRTVIISRDGQIIDSISSIDKLDGQIEQVQELPKDQEKILIEEVMKTSLVE